MKTVKLNFWAGAYEGKIATIISSGLICSLVEIEVDGEKIRCNLPNESFEEIK